MRTQELWTDIVRWLSINAPVTAKTIRAPAPEPLIRSFEQAAPNGWPSDLSTLYRIFDGTELSTAGDILPRYRPLPLEEAEKVRRMMLSIMAEVGAEANAEFERRISSPIYRNLRAVGEAHSSVPVPEPHKPYDPADAEADEAGTRAWIFISSFLPIADNGAGDFLFVDLRAGRQHGCVSEWFKDDADWRPAVWSSVEELLDETLTSLRTGRPVFFSRPSVTDGSLHWEYVRES
ncbi:cell wall assembly regulator SMI1 [Arthrobacter pascens]|uniref:SMI1/KNR4 family protein n=1 Tax=Arthrobacter pascens TaxID=1677 RepID=UPI002792A693|nr:SMI1/KNR4 family protein [Arthrobacter pascens]MDQ0676671.1 cell wall assembly regulator SMI1 [Arthrobacter pascens]